MASVQGIYLRARENQIDPGTLTPEVAQSIAQVEELVAYVDEDRPLESDLRKLMHHIQQQYFTLYRGN
jgi:histidine ammonia-lyase